MTARLLATIKMWGLGLIVAALAGQALAQDAASGEVPAPVSAGAASSSAADGGAIAADDAERAARGLFATVAVGGGVGARSISIPSRRSDRRLATGLFPALQIALRGELALRRRWLFGAAVSYLSSVGLQAAAVTPHAGNSVEGAQLRANSLTFGLLPGYRFGAARDSVSFRLLLGWGFRSVHSVVDLETPSYSLHGPTFRPELTVPLSRGLVVLRLAPELNLIVGASRILTELSNAALPGAAFGGEASIELRVLPVLNVVLAYRESHAMLSTAWGSYVRDSERFVTLQLSLQR